MDEPLTLPPDAVSPATVERRPIEALLRSLDFSPYFQAIPTPSIVLSPDLIIVAANAAYLRIAGRVDSDIIGCNIFDAFPNNPEDPHADGAANLRASLEKVLSTGCVDKMKIQRYDVATAADSVAFEMRYWKPLNTPVLNPDNTVRYIIHSVEEVTDTYLPRRGTLSGALATLTERIRDLKAVDDIGYAAATILGQALDTSRVGYGTINPVTDTLTVVRDWCAPGVESLAGTTDLRSYGSFIDDLKLDKFIAIENVDDDPRTAPAATALRGRSSAAFVNVPVVEGGVLVAVLFVNNAEVRSWSVKELVLIKEIAARIRTAGERLRGVVALSESEAKFRTITDAMPQMVWSTLADGKPDYYNEQWYRFTGLPRDSSEGAGWDAIFHPEDHERVSATWRACVETGTTYEIQYRLRHHSGNYRWVLGRALPVRASDGHILQWMGTYTDIDDHKHAEEELRQASRRKDEFLAMLAHELRNPLAPISSAAQLLILQDPDPQRVQKSGEIILRQVRHLTSLVDDLLDVSRVTRGLVQIERIAIDLNAVLLSAIEQARPGIEARNHRLEVELPSAQTLVKGDKKRLVQVVVNLLNNAAKYTTPGGNITLSLVVCRHAACIRIDDDGIGITPDLLPHIFDLFIQAERTPDRVQGGLGLGLALVKRIIELHDGSVQAASGGLGQGCSFIVKLPVPEPANMTEIGAPSLHGERLESATEAAGSVASDMPRLMIVDDHVDGAQSLASLLRAQGYPVLIAYDGPNGLRLAAETSIDIFILDIGLPGMDGYELARRLRASPGGSKAQLVALTGYGNAEDRLQALASGFDVHLVKPVDIDALTAVLENRKADQNAGRP
jgi:PAS domain S-box-containing protein